VKSPVETEILIIGSGLAGAVAAISAADEGKQVLIITKSAELKSGNTPKAQGGIVYTSSGDTPEKLKEDIIKAGDYHYWNKAVDQLCISGPELVNEYLIERFKVNFDLNSDKTTSAELSFTREAAHSEPRIIYSKDKTGDSIQTATLKAVNNHPNITALTDHTALDLLTLSHHSIKSADIYEKPACFGAMVLDNQNGEVKAVYAKRTILATGGLGQIFLHTTNPEESIGDGIAMAWRAGARCFNLQFIQFHPTTLFGSKDRFLISEAVRGEGGKLIDGNGNEFMQSVHEKGSLAPRDIVARGIHQTMLDTGQPCMFLDISFKKREWIENRFPSIYKNCLLAGVDMAAEPIPVVPAAHYSCGGVGVNLAGHTSLKRLYAVGEVACTGVHGANRLASTSLLEALVWGHEAGKDAAQFQEGDDYFPQIESWVEETEEIDPALIAQDWLTIKNTMWNYAGLIRTRQRLHRAQTILRNLQNEIEDFYQKARLSPSIVGLRNGIQTANAIITATLEARESRGTHYLLEDGE
jgi:L-aspartate oxidase